LKAHSVEDGPMRFERGYFPRAVRNIAIRRDRRDSEVPTNWYLQLGNVFRAGFWNSCPSFDHLDPLLG
jgi:hypothetical protein